MEEISASLNVRSIDRKWAEPDYRFLPISVCALRRTSLMGESP